MITFCVWRKPIWDHFGIGKLRFFSHFWNHCAQKKWEKRNVTLNKCILKQMDWCTKVRRTFLKRQYMNLTPPLCKRIISRKKRKKHKHKFLVDFFLFVWQCVPPSAVMTAFSLSLSSLCVYTYTFQELNLVQRCFCVVRRTLDHFQSYKLLLSETNKEHF